MRDKIEKILALQGCEGYDAIGEIIALIAPELEKARKWDRVKEIAASDYCSRCFNRFKCPSDDYAPCPFKDILEEVEGEKG